MTGEPKLQIRGLRKAFGPQVVLADIDLDIAAGDNLVLLGASGSGKTVLAKCILGLVKPDAGSIRINGVETTKLSADERGKLMHRFGVLFQASALFDSLPVWHNVAFGLINGNKLPRAQARAVAREKLAEVNLGDDVAVLHPAELSGGMQKRVALARAIANDPEILILDGPTAGLDPIMTAVIDNLILRSVHKLGATVLTITHDIESAMRIATRMAMLHEGRIVWEGPVAAVEQADNPQLRRFIHRPGEALPAP